MLSNLLISGFALAFIPRVKAFHVDSNGFLRFFFDAAALIVVSFIFGYLCQLFYRCPNCWASLEVTNNRWTKPNFTVTDCPNCGVHLRDAKRSALPPSPA